MRNRVVMTVVVVVSMLGVVPMLGAVVRAQNTLDATVHQIGYGLGLYRGFKETDYIVASQFDASGMMMVSGRMVKVPRYRAQMRWDHTAMRVDYDVETEKQRRVEAVAGKYAWNGTRPGAGLTPTAGAATPAPDAHRERMLQLWLSPHGAAKAAKLAGANVTLSEQGGRPVVTFALPAPLESTSMSVTLNPTNARPENVAVKTPSGLLEATYTDYKDFDNSDVYYPSRIVQTLNGEVVLDLTVSAGEGYNPYVIIPVPESIGVGQKNFRAGG